MHDWMNVPILHGFYIIACGGELKFVFVTKCEHPAEITLSDEHVRCYEHVHEHVQCHGIYILLHMYMYMYIHIDYQS